MDSNNHGIFFCWHWCLSYLKFSHLLSQIVNLFSFFRLLEDFLGLKRESRSSRVLKRTIIFVAFCVMLTIHRLCLYGEYSGQLLGKRNFFLLFLFLSLYFRGLYNCRRIMMLRWHCDWHHYFSPSWQGHWHKRWVYRSHWIEGGVRINARLLDYTWWHLMTVFAGTQSIILTLITELASYLFFNLLIHFNYYDF